MKGYDDNETLQSPSSPPKSKKIKRSQEEALKENKILILSRE